MTATDRRAEAGFARRMEGPRGDLYPGAGRVRVVRGIWNPRTAGARHEALEPAAARRPAAGVGFHDTPKHAPWLNRAERGLSVPARRCLSRRIPDAAMLAAEVRAWQGARDRDRVRIG